MEIAPSREIFKNPMHPYTKALFSALLEPSLECRSKKAELIKGEVSNPVNPKPGCRFAPRCPHVSQSCTNDDIPLREVSPGHFVSCTLCN